MKRLLLRPCDSWAEQLAVVHPTDLTPAERAALTEHLAVCPGCAAMRAAYWRMDEQIRRLPDPQPLVGLPPRLLQLWAEEDHRAGSRQPVVLPRVSEAFMQTTTNTGVPAPEPAPLHAERRTRRRLVSGITAIAAVLIIALITTALFVSHSTPKSTPTSNQGPPRPTPTPGNRGWVSVPALTNLSVQPEIAPSNPQVVYEASRDLTIFRRSDDEGAHWKNLSLPVQVSQVEYAALVINAGNAQNIFLSLTLPQSSSACSGSQAPTGQSNAYSGNSCGISYYSTDGGADWGLMHFPSGISIVGLGVIVQGDRLYIIAFDANQNRRLVSSTDGGANWQLADSSLLAQGEDVCSFAAPAAGSMLFALVQSGYCTQPVGYLAMSRSQAQGSETLWRSDDAGAHWKQVSAFPFAQPDAQNFTAINTRGAAQPTLYTAAGQGNAYTRLFSADGGKTWQPLPTQGLPTSATQVFDGGPLSDGSILAVVTEKQGNASSFYAWKPGDQAWHQVTPTFIGDTYTIVVSSAGGHDTIWLTIDVNYTTFTAYKYTLQ